MTEELSKMADEAYRLFGLSEEGIRRCKQHEQYGLIGWAEEIIHYYDNDDDIIENLQLTDQAVSDYRHYVDTGHEDFRRVLLGRLYYIKIALGII